LDFSVYPSVTAKMQDNGSCKILIERFDDLPELSDTPTSEELADWEALPATESRSHEFDTMELAYSWLSENAENIPLHLSFYPLQLERVVTGQDRDYRFMFQIELPDDAEARLVVLEQCEGDDHYSIWLYGMGHGVRDMTCAKTREACGRLFSDRLNIDDLYEILEL